MSRLGEVKLQSKYETEVNGNQEKIEITLMCGFEAASKIWTLYHVDLMDFLQERENARMGTVEMLHILQKEQYTQQQLWEAFMPDLEAFQTFAPELMMALPKVIGFDEQRLAAATAPDNDGSEKKSAASKRRSTKSRSTK